MQSSALATWLCRQQIFGVTGVEPATLSSQMIYATKLHYTPQFFLLKRIAGLEPASSAWKAEALPLDDIRNYANYAPLELLHSVKNTLRGFASVPLPKKHICKLYVKARE